MTSVFILTVAATWAAAHPVPAPTAVIARAVEAVAARTYEARIRIAGRVTTTQVRASDAGHAKKVVQAQFPTATVLSVRRVD